MNAYAGRAIARTQGSLAAILLLAAIAGSAAAQSFPTGPVKLIYPFPPGSSGDLAARLLANESEKSLGQAVVVENRPGASGRLGLNALALAQGNGHTLSVVVNGLMVVLPLTDSRFTVEPGKDYAPVTLAFESYGVLVGKTGLPFRDVRGLIGYARENPGKLTVASSGIGSNPHLIMELLKSSAGIDLTHVPYKGETPALTDMMAGQIDLMFTVAGAKPYVDAGKLVSLATTGSKRWNVFPASPTMEEAGVPGLQASTWWGVVAPAGTPPEAVSRLNGAFRAALQNPSVQGKLVGYGMEIIASSPEELVTRINGDRRRWGPVIKNAGIKLD